MIIKAVRVQNFRSLQDAELTLDSLTALVGANGAGKSAFLHALDLFYSTNPRYGPDDFYAGDTAKTISIRVTLSDLTPEEMAALSSHVQGETLTVEKELSWPAGGQSQLLYGWTRQASDFRVIRDLIKDKKPASEKRKAYDELKGHPAYADLPNWTSQDALPGSLSEWETIHSEACDWERDDGRFFGWTSVGQHNLSANTKFILVPAVRDASQDASEVKGSPIYEIMELVVRSRLAQRDDMRQLLEQTQTAYRELLDPAKAPELKNLGEELTATLRTFVPDARVLLSWAQLEDIKPPVPHADVKLLDEENAHPCPVDRTGHGLQRSLILSMLQHLIITRAASEKASAAEGAVSPDASEGKSPVASGHLILAVEEPELYLHPNRQRHLARVLLGLSTGKVKGVAERMQIIYTTHSPFFVGIDRFHQVRVLRKSSVEEGRPKATRVWRATWNDVAGVIDRADGKPPGTQSGKTLEVRVHNLMTPWMSEGFFADLIVLVEGEEDRAAILAQAAAEGHDLEREGISVIPCMGKNNIHNAFAIFKALRIPAYFVWDGDNGQHRARPEANHRLLRLIGLEPQDWPSFVRADCACFGTTLTKELRDELGGQWYDSTLDNCRAEFAISRDPAKNPCVVREIIQRAAEEGKTSATLGEIVRQIMALRHASRGSEMKNGSPVGV
jgi:putative ATP-dependent endonuclease of OLD family